MKNHETETAQACLLALAIKGAVAAHRKTDDYMLLVIVVGSDNHSALQLYGHGRCNSTYDGQPPRFGRLGYRVKFRPSTGKEEEPGKTTPSTASRPWMAREEEYQWQGPNVQPSGSGSAPDSDIHTPAGSGRQGSGGAVHHKAGGAFLNAEQNGSPRLRRLYSVAEPDLDLHHPDRRGLCGCPGHPRKRHPAVHEGLQRRIPHSDEPLMTARLGVAFSKIAAMTCRSSFTSL